MVCPPIPGTLAIPETLAISGTLEAADPWDVWMLSSSRAVQPLVPKSLGGCVIRVGRPGPGFPFRGPSGPARPKPALGPLRRPGACSQAEVAAAGGLASRAGLSWDPLSEEVDRHSLMVLMRRPGALVGAVCFDWVGRH